MTDFADLKTQIAEWANREDWSDVLVTSFIRMAEQKFNAELRVRRMLKLVQNTITCRCSSVPDDWLESELMSLGATISPGGWLPIKYKSRDEFFQLPDKRSCQFYTIEADVITFGGPPDTTEGIDYQMWYFAEVPVLSDTTTSWIYTKYPTLYLHAALMNADLHAVGEEDKSANMKQMVEDTIGKLNAEYLRSKASGSRLVRTRRRTFG